VFEMMGKTPFKKSWFCRKMDRSESFSFRYVSVCFCDLKAGTFIDGLLNSFFPTCSELITAPSIKVNSNIKNDRFFEIA
jgi:hypothetical protein